MKVMTRLDGMARTIDGELGKLRAVMQGKNYPEPEVWLGIGFMGYPFYLGVKTSHRSYGSYVYGQDGDSLSELLSRAREAVEKYPPHIEWTDELVAATLGIEDRPPLDGMF